MGFLAGKKALIVGLATDRSIAWGISQAMQPRRRRARLQLPERPHQGPRRRARGRTRLDARDADGRRHRRRDRRRVRAAARRMDGARRHRPLGRLRAARGADRRIRRGDDPRELRKRARCVELQPDGARAGRPAAHGGPRGRDPDALLPRRRALDSRLQRHGAREGEPRGERALPRGAISARRTSA